MHRRSHPVNWRSEFGAATFPGGVSFVSARTAVRMAVSFRRSPLIFTRPLATEIVDSRRLAATYLSVCRADSSGIRRNPSPRYPESARDYPASRLDLWRPGFRLIIVRLYGPAPGWRSPVHCECVAKGERMRFPIALCGTPSRVAARCSTVLKGPRLQRDATCPC
jgi:hypothetical protein